MLARFSLSYPSLLSHSTLLSFIAPPSLLVSLILFLAVLVFAKPCDPSLCVRLVRLSRWSSAEAKKSAHGRAWQLFVSFVCTGVLVIVHTCLRPCPCALLCCFPPFVSLARVHVRSSSIHLFFLLDGLCGWGWLCKRVSATDSLSLCPFLD